VSARRIGAVAARLVRQLVRARRALALVLVAPIVIMGLLAAIIQSEDERPRVALVATGLGGLFLPELEGMLEEADEEDAGFELVDLPPDTAPKQAVSSGLVDAVLVVPDSFLAERADGKRSNLRLVVEGADPMRTAAIFSRFRKTVPDSLSGLPRFLPTDCAAHCADTVPDGPPTFDVEKVYGQDVEEQIDFFTPVLPPFFVFFFGFLLSGMTFLRERVSGTAERLLATPLRRSELVAGYVLGFLPLGLTQAAVVIAFTRYALGGPWGGWTVVAMIVVLCLVAECIGLFVSAFARSEFQVMQFIPVVIVPQFLLCGVIWPVAHLPGWLQVLAYCMPVTYAVEAIRDVSLRGLGFVDVWHDFAALCAFALVGLALASVSVRRVVW